MLRIFKTFFWMLLLAAGLPAAHAFTLGGPIGNGGDNWQVPDLGYNVPDRSDFVAPKNLGEEFRRNLPIVYYSFDQNFLDFFGSNGVASVDQAFAILNGLTNVSSYSADLSEVPLETIRVNYRAEALGLMDIKSEVLGLMMEQLGLANPLRYTWCLHDRFLPPGAGNTCRNNEEYLVTMRNFGYVPSPLDQLQYSPYVNGVLYTYLVYDYCDDPHPGEPQSEAWVLPVNDTYLYNNDYRPVTGTISPGLPFIFSPALGGDVFFYSGLADGEFFTGLTRDDVAGLRYLLGANNVNWEDLPLGSVALVTNNTAAGLAFLETSNLNDLVSASLNLDDAAFAAQFPNVVTTGPATPSFVLQVTPNTTAYYTNYPWNPVGTAPTLILATTYSTNVGFVYQRSFANVISNFMAFTNGQAIPSISIFTSTNNVPITNITITTVDSSVGSAASPWLPVGTFSLVTNTTVTTISVPGLAGDYFVAPPNTCGIQVLSNLLTQVTVTTNSITATNGAAGGAGVGTTTNANFASFSQTILTYTTNHYFAYFPVNCAANYSGLRRGIEKITFVRRDFDSLLGRFFYPQLTNWNMTTVTNSRDLTQVFQRTATAPDYLFTASDLASGPAAVPVVALSARTAPNWNVANVLPTLAGPGVIDSPTTITLNKSGPIFLNEAPDMLDELTGMSTTALASFDETTNVPVVYPNGTSIESMENMILIQVTTTSTNAQVGHPFFMQLAGTGGTPYTTPPYTPSSPGPYYYWSLTPGSPGLPPGLSLAVDGSGAIGGNPSAVGIYDFTVRITDSNARYADWNVTITVSP